MSESFDAYEILPVIEYEHTNWEKFCDPYGNEAEAVASAAEYVKNHPHCTTKLMWSLYGHLPSGGVECFFDGESKADCVRIYRLITGSAHPIEENNTAEFNLPRE